MQSPYKQTARPHSFTACEGRHADRTAPNPDRTPMPTQCTQLTTRAPSLDVFTVHTLPNILWRQGRGNDFFIGGAAPSPFPPLPLEVGPP